MISELLEGLVLGIDPPRSVKMMVDPVLSVRMIILLALVFSGIILICGYLVVCEAPEPLEGGDEDEG